MTGATKREVRLFPDAAPLTRRAAEEFVHAATDAVAKTGSFTVALSGGSTPKALYSLLVDDHAFPLSSSLGQNAFLLWGRAPRSSRSQRQQLPHGQRCHVFPLSP